MQLFKKKGNSPIVENKQPENPKEHGRSSVTKISMPIKIPCMQYSMLDIKRYFLYNNSPTVIMSTIERRVQDELASRNNIPIGKIAIIFTIGLAGFLIMLGAYILLQSPAAGHALQQGTASTIQTISQPAANQGAVIVG